MFGKRMKNDGRKETLEEHNESSACGYFAWQKPHNLYAREGKIVDGCLKLVGA
jgi:hypothetical protein